MPTSGWLENLNFNGEGQDLETFASLIYLWIIVVKYSTMQLIHSEKWALLQCANQSTLYVWQGLKGKKQKWREGTLFYVQRLKKAR